MIGVGVAWIAVGDDPGDAGPDADMVDEDADLPVGDADVDGAPEALFGAAGGRCECRAGGGGGAGMVGLMRLLPGWR